MCAEEETPTTILRWRPSQYSSLVSNILVIAEYLLFLTIKLKKVLMDY